VKEITFTRFKCQNYQSERTEHSQSVEIRHREVHDAQGQNEQIEPIHCVQEIQATDGDYFKHSFDDKYAKNDLSTTNTFCFLNSNIRDLATN